MGLSPQEIVAKTGELPTLPHVATKVMRLVGDPGTSAKDVQGAIITDQGMTGQILKISNSAMFGMKREVRTLTHAIMLLGFDTIRSIVVASASKKLYAGKGGTGFKEKLIWENSIGSALIARGISEQFSNMDKEEAFIGGLMHNMGKTVLNTKLAESYSRIMAASYNEGTPIYILERKELGFDHAELGYCLIKQWNLSESLANAVRHYLEPEKAPPEHRRLTAAISLGTMFCADMGLGVSQPIPLEEQRIEPIKDILALTDDRLDLWRKVVAKNLEKDADMIKGL